VPGSAVSRTTPSSPWEAECPHNSSNEHSGDIHAALQGKYLEGGGPPDARLNRYKGRYAEAESRYGPKPNVEQAVAAYAKLASKHGLSPTQLALRFVLSNPLTAAAVVGATTAAQLEEQLAATRQGPLPAEILGEIDTIHR